MKNIFIFKITGGAAAPKHRSTYRRVASGRVLMETVKISVKEKQDLYQNSIFSKLLYYSTH